VPLLVCATASFRKNEDLWDDSSRMKGFPNQVAELSKLAIGMRALTSIIDEGSNPKDDGIFGQALVRVGVAGTGHISLPVDEYIRQQLTKPASNQSFRTTARGLRELYRLLDFIDDSGLQIQVTDLGRQAASYADMPIDAEQMDFWRRTIRNLKHGDAGQVSHPYQVLLRLVGQKPGITRAKCALALEAQNDSPQELARIVALADLSEEEIRERIKETESNWDNAKKVLPAFAEQLQDVVRDGQSFMLADAPGRADAGTAQQGERKVVVRAPRTSRLVTPNTIGRAGTKIRSDEFNIAREVNPAAIAEAKRLLSARLRRHNLIVQELASRLDGAKLYEDPFDLLALIEAIGILFEVKTLDGTDADQKDRVRDALAQLLYYEAFVATPIIGEAAVHKIACFEGPVSDAHREWLNNSGIGVIWKVENDFEGDALAKDFLGDHIQLR